MRYGFINNFAQALSGELAQGATSMTLDDNGALLDNASAEMVYTLTLFDVTSGENEIVYVTAASGNDLTVERGKEGTADRAWPTGTQVEMRLTAGVVSTRLNLVLAGEDNSLSVGPGASATTENAISIGPGATASHEDSGEFYSGSIAIGLNATSTGDRSLAIGREAIADKYGAVALGSSRSQGVNSIAIGAVWLNSPTSVGVGSVWDMTGKNSVAVGYDLLVGDYDTTSGLGEYAVVVGTNSYLHGRFSASFGAYNYSTAQAGYSVAIGPGAYTSVEAGVRVNGVPYLPAVPEGMGTDAQLGYDVQATLYDNQPAISRRTSSQTVMATDPLDLAESSAHVTLDMPAGALLFIDAIDIVIVEADGAGGDPEIVIGQDDQDPDTYLAATAVTKTTVGGRETHDALTHDGVTSLRVAVDTAGTGTYRAKVIFRGYVMEV